MSEQGIDPGVAAFLWRHATSNFTTLPVNLTGRTALVTGANAGLGFATAVHLARNGISRIIIASRNLAKSQEAAKQIYATVPSFRGKIDIKTVDLMSFASVVAFCDEIKADPDRLDIVVANAGIMTANYKQTKDGWESVLQVNALSTGLMSLLLLPKLVETGKLGTPQGGEDFKPHLTIVASEVHYWAKFPQKTAQGSLLQALNDEKQFVDGSERYNVSKLFDLFIAREIVKLPIVASGQVNVNTVNPGLCKSDFRDDMGPVLATIFNWLAWTCEFGSRSIFHAATQPTAPGAFVSNCQEVPPSIHVVSAEGKAAQKKFWEESVELWKGLAPGVKEVIA